MWGLVEQFCLDLSNRAGLRLIFIGESEIVVAGNGPGFVLPFFAGTLTRYGNAISMKIGFRYDVSKAVQKTPVSSALSMKHRLITGSLKAPAWTQLKAVPRWSRPVDPVAFQKCGQQCEEPRGHFSWRLNGFRFPHALHI